MLQMNAVTKRPYLKMPWRKRRAMKASTPGETGRRTPTATVSRQQGIRVNRRPYLKKGTCSILVLYVSSLRKEGDVSFSEVSRGRLVKKGPYFSGETIELIDK